MKEQLMMREKYDVGLQLNYLLEHIHECNNNDGGNPAIRVIATLIEVPKSRSCQKYGQEQNGKLNIVLLALRVVPERLPLHSMLLPFDSMTGP